MKSECPHKKKQTKSGGNCYEKTRVSLIGCEGCAGAHMDALLKMDNIEVTTQVIYFEEKEKSE